MNATNPIDTSAILAVRVAVADQERDEIRVARLSQREDETIEQTIERLAVEAEAARATAANPDATEGVA